MSIHLFPPFPAAHNQLYIAPPLLWEKEKLIQGYELLQCDNTGAW